MCVMCVWWDEGAVPQTRRCGQLGVPLPSSGTAPRSASSPGGESLDRAPTAGAVAARASSPGPNARIFVARPPRSIAPSPSPAAGKGHPRTGGGGAARGTLARALWSPSHPSLPPAGAFAPGRVRAPLSAVLFCFVFHFYLLSFRQPYLLFFLCLFSVFLLLLLILSPSLCHFLFLSLSASVSLSHSHRHSALTTLGTPLPPPSQLTTAGSTHLPLERRFGQAPFSWVQVGLQESPPLSPQWAWLGGVFSWLHRGGGCSHPSRRDNSCRRHWIDCFFAHRGEWG